MKERPNEVAAPADASPGGMSAGFTATGRSAAASLDKARQAVLNFSRIREHVISYRPATADPEDDRGEARP